MTGNALGRRRPFRRLVAAACAWAMLAVGSAQAQTPAPAPAEIHYFSYLKRWPADSKVLSGPDNCDSDGGAPKPGRYRVQIVRYHTSAGQAGAENERVAFRFGLAVEGSTKGVHVERVADITIESDRQVSGPDGGGRPHIAAPGPDQKTFSWQVAELLQPLSASGSSPQSAGADPLKVLRILCGKDPVGSSPDTKIKLWRIDDILGAQEAPSSDELGAIAIFYDPSQKVLRRESSIDEVYENSKKHEIFYLADYVGQYHSNFHRELHTAFKNDVRAASNAWRPPSPPPGGGSSQASAPRVSEEAASAGMDIGRIVIIGLLVALVALILTASWWFLDRLRGLEQRLDELGGRIRKVEHREPAREDKALAQHVSHQAIELEDLKARGIQIDERFEAFNERFRTLEYHVSQNRAVAEEDDLAVWRERVDGLLQQLMNAVRTLDEASDRKNQASDAGTRAARLALTTSGDPALATTRRSTSAFPAPPDERDAAPPRSPAATPSRPVAERPNSLTDLEHRAGMPFDWGLLTKELGPSPKLEAILRWIVEQYLPERRDAAFYGSIGEWVSRASQGRAELVVPVPGSAYEKELHEIGGYGPQQYGSLDRIVGLVRPGLRYAGRTVIKPRVIVPS